MKKGDKAKKVLGLVVVFLIVIVSLFVGVVSAEAIIIDTEKGESGFWTEPARDLPANWWYAHDHPDTSADGYFDTNAYPPGQGNGSFWYTISFPGMDECKGIWETSLPHSGEYEVFAWIPSPDHFDPYLDESTPPSDYLPTKRAQYKVFHNNGVTTVTTDQNEGGFTSFGIFDFDNTARVELSSNGVEFWRSVAFDAVKFVPTTKGIPEGTLREVDVVKHLEWAGPEGTQPDTYAEYREGRKYEIGPVAPIPWSKEDIFVQVCVLKDLPQDAEYEAIKGIPSTIAVYHFYLKDPKIAGSGVFEKVDSISLTKINESTYCGSKLIKKW
ncbi:MAG: hypothetical protein IMF19_15030, partial [Proteobacteria bacterium]|nr:hypothetical protein [Pseudomonadota bacterium]